jgi:precorrin-2/cobalt-factor-2 C20-methyltransferase
MKLSFVSLGPGDFELMSIKALKALQNSSVICVPTKSSDNSFKKSLTYKIVKEAMEEFSFDKPILPIYAPMQFKKEDWKTQVELLVENLKNHKDVCFVTLGDSAVYSSVYYLLEVIQTQYPHIYEKCEVIAGITSFSQASAISKKPLCLGDSKLQIIPLLDKEVPTTTIYMRPKIGLDTKDIKEQGELYTYENLNFDNQKIYPYKKSRVDRYMTLFIDFCYNRL